MKNHLLSILLLFALLIFIAGCMEPPPIQEPSVSVSEITVSDISLEAIKVNTTIIIFNPNPIDAKLTKVVLDLYYLDDAQNYLGHSEQSAIDIIKNGNTTVTLPVIHREYSGSQGTGITGEERIHYTLCQWLSTC